MFGDRRGGRAGIEGNAVLEFSQMLFGEIEEGGKLEVSGAPFWKCVLIGDGDGDAFHAGCFGRDQPVKRIFERETLERIGG
jgi:hypothetical protein